MPVLYPDIWMVLNAGSTLTETGNGPIILKRTIKATVYRVSSTPICILRDNSRNGNPVRIRVEYKFYSWTYNLIRLTTKTFYTASGAGSHVRSCKLVDFDMLPLLPSIFRAVPVTPYEVICCPFLDLKVLV